MVAGTLFSQCWPLLVISDHCWSLVPVGPTWKLLVAIAVPIQTRVCRQLENSKSRKWELKKQKSKKKKKKLLPYFKTYTVKIQKFGRLLENTAVIILIFEQCGFTIE